MEIALTPQQEQRLGELARNEGKNVGELLLDVANSVLRSEEERWHDIEIALDQIKRGEALSEEEMDVRFAAMLSK